MTLRLRILLAYSLVLVVGAYVLFLHVVDEAKPRYREAVEESMVDTAQILAAWLAAETRAAAGEGDGPPALVTNRLAAAMTQVARRRLTARIYRVTKRRVDLRVYVCDGTGRVVYDSLDRWTGQDFSTKNDVWLTLRGRYGVRTSRADQDDPRTSAMYVAAPVEVDGELVGVLTVVKPVDAVLQFMVAARRRFGVAMIPAVGGILLLAWAVGSWVTRPLRALIAYARAIRDGEKPVAPAPGPGELGELTRAMEEMRDALEGKAYVERYTRALAHEMKSPIAAIRGAVELLEDDMPDEDRARFLGNVAAESLRLQRAVERLLLLASLENRSTLSGVEDIDPGVLAAEVLAEARPRAEALGVELVPPAEGAARLRGERILLRHALGNLVENALAFTPSGARVGVEVEERADGTRVAVWDEGPGLPDYALERAFERFFSTERPGSMRKSTGLGLAFVREVAALHGGEAGIENREGKGARAWFTVAHGAEGETDGHAHDAEGRKDP